MRLEPYQNIAIAYQLHYYLCCQVYRRGRLENEERELINVLLPKVTDRYTMHLLEHVAEERYVRVLTSLRPEQSVAETAQILKSLTARELVRPHPWARGYFARSTGKVRQSVIARYIDSQEAHHGHDRRVLSPVGRFVIADPVRLLTPHADIDLSFHVVLATERRLGVFNKSIAQAVWDYWQRVAAKHQFAIDRATFLPDHIHLMIRLRPVHTPAEASLWLMNNGQHFLGKHFPFELIRLGLNRLWAPSCYIGTTGKWNTAQLKSYLVRGPAMT